MHRINFLNSKTRLFQLIKRALSGEGAGIPAAGEPMDRLNPKQPRLAPRQGGQLKGKIWIADIFDEFDEELEEMFYGGKE
jgi:antitoxin (DNA-binding transcriptional repressor) of toxin-antitoxin stability system